MTSCVDVINAILWRDVCTLQLAECDDDVSDVTDKLGVLIFEIGELEDNFIGIMPSTQFKLIYRPLRPIPFNAETSPEHPILRSTLS